MFRRCPSCKKLFDDVEAKKEVLEAYEVQEHGFHGSVKEIHVENIRVTFKCKNCGHEWTDINQKTI